MRMVSVSPLIDCPHTNHTRSLNLTNVWLEEEAVPFHHKPLQAFSDNSIRLGISHGLYDYEAYRYLDRAT